MGRIWLCSMFAVAAALFIGFCPSAAAQATDNDTANIANIDGEAGLSHNAAHGEDDAHHGPTPANANAGESMNSLLAWQSEKALWTLVVFFLTLLGLYLIAWKPITEALEKRERTIANNISDAKNASEQALARLKEYESRLALAASQATDIVTQARKDAELAGQRIIAESQAEAARQRDRALADIDAAKQMALSEMAAKSTDIAFSLARKIVGRELQPTDHQNLIQDALTRMPSKN